MKNDPKGNYYLMPNAIFSLGLSSGELAVYSYLRKLVDNKTYTCFPSQKNIASATGMNVSTVRKHLDKLTEKNLIAREPTVRTGPHGEVWNSTLKYTVLPIKNAEQAFYAHQMAKLDAATEKQKVRQAMAQKAGKNAGIDEISLFDSEDQKTTS